MTGGSSTNTMRESPHKSEPTGRGSMTSLIVLALLAVADGITTHIGLSLGGVELNPLLAALFAVHPLVGEAVRVAGWLAIIGFFWWAHARARARVWRGCVGGAIVLSGIVVSLNTLQLLLWWLA